MIDSRAIKDETVIRRRRECLACEHRFTTYEEIERDDLRVLKRDGRYEAFDRKKLVAGIDKACEKRPVSREAIERTVNEMIDEVGEDESHPLASLMEVIGVLIEKYEDEHVPQLSSLAK